MVKEKFNKQELELIKAFKDGKAIIYDDNLEIFKSISEKVKNIIENDSNLYIAQKLSFIHESNQVTNGTKYYYNHINKR